MHRGKLLFVSQVFSKEGYLLGSRSEKDNLEGIRKRKTFHHLDTTRAHANKWRGQKLDSSTKIK